MQLTLTKVRAFLYLDSYEVSLCKEPYITSLVCRNIYLQSKLNIMLLPPKFYLWRRTTNFGWKLSYVGCFAVVNFYQLWLCLKDVFRVLRIRSIKTLVLATTAKIAWFYVTLRFTAFSNFLAAFFTAFSFTYSPLKISFS